MQPNWHVLTHTHEAVFDVSPVPVRGTRTFGRLRRKCHRAAGSNEVKQFQLNFNLTLDFQFGIGQTIARNGDAGSSVCKKCSVLLRALGIDGKLFSAECQIV